MVDKSLRGAMHSIKPIKPNTIPIYLACFNIACVAFSTESFIGSMLKCTS